MNTSSEDFVDMDDLSEPEEEKCFDETPAVIYRIKYPIHSGLKVKSVEAGHEANSIKTKHVSTCKDLSQDETSLSCTDSMLESTASSQDEPFIKLEPGSFEEESVSLSIRQPSNQGLIKNDLNTNQEVNPSELNLKAELDLPVGGSTESHLPPSSSIDSPEDKATTSEDQNYETYSSSPFEHNIFNDYFHSLFKNERFYQCMFCEYGTYVKSNLNQHIRNIHYGEKPHQCPHCDHKSSQKNNLKKHIDTVHRGEKPYQCPYCDHRASLKTNLINHVKGVHQGQKPFMCHLCDYKTSLKSNLNKHIKGVHEGEKPFQCPQCEYRASLKSNVDKHINRVHVGGKPFVCPQCNFRSHAKSDLNRHIDVVHRRIKPYQCSLCSVQTSKRSHLNYHCMSVHKCLKPDQ